MSIANEMNAGDTIPLFRLNDSVIRLKEEHSMLHAALQEIYALTCMVKTEEDVQRLNREMILLRIKMADFKAQLDAHSNWEETELFPMAAAYFDGEIDVYKMMEQEHEFTEDYVTAFKRMLDNLTLPIQLEDAKQIATFSFQVYVKLTNHFRDEEELLASLQDRSNKYDF